MVAGTEKTVSIQTNPHKHNDFRAIVEEGERLAKLSPNFVIKMPCTNNGFRACKILSAQGIRTNLTLCFTPIQALQAMRMGAFYVSPFIGWKESNGEEVSEFIDEVTTIRDVYDYQTEVLVAAVRNARQITEAALTGADIVTCGYAVYKEAFENPYTDMGLGRFQGFWDQTQYE